MNMFKQMSTIMTMHGKHGLWSMGFSAVLRFRGKSLEWDAVSLFWGYLMQTKCLNVH